MLRLLGKAIAKQAAGYSLLLLFFAILTIFASCPVDAKVDCV